MHFCFIFLVIRVQVGADVGRKGRELKRHPFHESAATLIESYALYESSQIHLKSSATQHQAALICSVPKHLDRFEFVCVNRARPQVKYKKGVK